MEASRSPHGTELANVIAYIEIEEAGYQWLIPTSIALLLFLHFISRFIPQRGHKNYKNFPPSPPRLPIIGHLHLLKQQPLHRSLHELSKKYGQILYLQFGTRKVLLVSSAPAVEDCFTKNDIIFANRPSTLAGKHLNYNHKVVGLASYGDHWRNLRRLMTVKIFSSNRLAMFSEIREDEVRILVKQIFEESRKRFTEIELKTRFVDLSFNIMVRIISGKRYYGKGASGKEGLEFQNLMKEALELDGCGNLNDLFPILQWIDFKRLEKRMREVMNKLDKFFQNLLEEQKRNRSVNGSNMERKMTLIEVMLQLQESEPEFYTDETVKGVILAMLEAGSETSSATVEWALSLLLNHPEAMNKLREELDNNVGQDRMINESDLPKLPFLQNVITETLRLFPVAPLLIPHESSDDCKVCGFDIPRGTMLFVNLWSLHRDADLWEDPTRFTPERFEGKKDGEAYNMIPFGVGRRACPGDKLAKRVIGITLGALVQCFEWKRIGEEEINMMEGEGITMPKVEPLIALCKPRNVMENVLLNLSTM